MSPQYSQAPFTSKDVRQFLNDEFEEINHRYKWLAAKHGGKWPREGDLGILEDKSSGYFILVKTAMRYVRPDTLRGRMPDDRLRDVLEALRADALAPLDTLYLFILRQNVPQDPTDLEEWKATVGLICIPLEDFSEWTGAFGDDAFRVLYGKDRHEIEEMTRDLGAIFYTDKESGQPCNYHKSFPDCIFNPKRSDDLYVDPRRLHERIACAIIGSLNWIHISDEDGTISSVRTLRAEADDHVFFKASKCLTNPSSQRSSSTALFCGVSFPNTSNGRQQS